MADIEEANPPPSYRFSYTVISAMFMACLSGAEDVDGVVDADQGVIRLMPHERGGELYVVERALLIDASLLRDSVDRSGFLRVNLGLDPPAATLKAIEDALGTGLSALIAGGEWPAHPNEITSAAIAASETIVSIPANRPGSRGIRIVLDSVAYFEIVGQSAEDDDESPPIIDAYVGSGGEVDRIVVRRADTADPTRPETSGDGYAMDYDFDRNIDIDVPVRSVFAERDPADLPTETVPIPCQVEP